MTSEPSDSDPKEFADLRIDYSLSRLSRDGVNPDPVAQFRAWLDNALEANVEEPNAMTLATVSPGGRPSTRIVLLKGLGLEGGAFHFYTNYESRKGRELASNPHAALNFHWKPLQRQVNVFGVVEQLDRDASNAYFQTRPYDSQIGAWVSAQSEEVESRAWLEQRRNEFVEQYPEGHVPLPPFWGGFRLVPDTIEFWQGRPGRLHDRILYQKQADATWRISRLSP